MQLGSTSRNINILSFSVTLGVIVGFFEPNMFTYHNLMLAVVSFYILNILGNWMTLHRYFAHKSFEFKNNIFKWVFIILAVLAGRGSPLGWSYLHRKHHAHADTNKDPHSPEYLGYKLFGFGHYKKQEKEQMQIFIVKDLMTKEQLFIHKWYVCIVLTFIVALACISIELLYFGWMLPAFLIQLSQNNFNYFGHKYGYRNFSTNDNSKNNIWMFPFILGETWHNNHHYDSKNFSTKILNYEYDPVGLIIRLLKK